MSEEEDLYERWVEDFGKFWLKEGSRPYEQLVVSEEEEKCLMYYLNESWDRTQDNEERDPLK